MCAEQRADLGEDGAASELSRDIDLDEIALFGLRAAIRLDNFLERNREVRPTRDHLGIHIFNHLESREMQQGPGYGSSYPPKTSSEWQYIHLAPACVASAIPRARLSMSTEAISSNK